MTPLRALLGGGLLALTASAWAQDSTQFIRQGQEVLHRSHRGTRRIAYFEYAGKRYPDPRRRTVFTEKVLIPLANVRGDSAARAALGRYSVASG